MKITQRFQNAIESFRKTTNSNSSEEIALSREFLKYGTQKPLVQDWSKVVMSDKELYSGYPYAAITTRANKLTQLAVEDIKTDAVDSIMKTVTEDDEVIHPYLELIDTSKTFTNQQFWYNISTYLDLVGVYYLMAVRTVEKTDTTKRVGNIQSFKLLNPYDIRRIINEETGEVGGYVEARNGLVREIQPEMIIEMRKLNPFSNTDPYAMTDAAKEYQFALKQAGDYTRHSLKNNMAAPGIISTDVILDREQFQNFVARITNQEKGLPLFGNGAGSVTWDAMQINLDNASLDKITEINRSTLFAVSGVSKTLMAIEESGTTRETAKVQKDLFLENHVIPQLQLIIDALNQDYKNMYTADYEKYGYNLYIDNPLKSDKDAENVEKDIEIKEIEIRSRELELYTQLINLGYTKETSALYSEGDIDIDELVLEDPDKLYPPKEETPPEVIVDEDEPNRPEDIEGPPQEPKPKQLITPASETTQQAITVKHNHIEKKLKETDKEENANPNRDSEGRFTFGPNRGDAGGSGKIKKDKSDKTKETVANPNYVATKKEAEEKIKSSKYKETLYHGTLSGNVDSIKEEGFNTDKKSLGRMFGDGVYFTSDKDVAKSYSNVKMDEVDFAGTLQAKINVKNPAIFDTDENRFNDAVMDWGIANERIAINKYETVDDIPQSLYYGIVKDFSNSLLEKHDAIVNGGYFDTLVIVKNPKDIVVFDGPPKGDKE
jgi:hypothetical protein